MLTSGVLDLQDFERHSQDGKDVVKVVGGIELGMVGHVRFAEEGRGADEGIRRDLGDERGIQGGVGAGFGLDGDCVGAAEGLEVYRRVGGGGSHGHLCYLGSVELGWWHGT